VDRIVVVGVAAAGADLVIEAALEDLEASRTLLIEDFSRHVRAGRHFWIDAPAALETLRILDAVYDQSPGLDRPPPA
jgi:hypothetical protein